MHRLLHMLHTIGLMKDDPNWRDTLKNESETRGKAAIAIFAVVILLCLLVRVLA